MCEAQKFIGCYRNGHNTPTAMPVAPKEELIAAGWFVKFNEAYMEGLTEEDHRIFFPN
jgi:hypothetical protein